MSKQHKFRKMKKAREEIARGFPVALKHSQQSEDPNEKHSWLSVIAEETDEPEVLLENYTTLHTQHKIDWIKLLSKILSVTDTEMWNITIFFFIFINYFGVTYGYFFMRRALNTTMRTIIIICDSAYGMDFLCATIIYFWKKLQLRLVNPPRSKILLLIDACLVIPYGFIHEAAYNDNESLTFVCLRSISCLRIYRLIKYFHNNSSRAGKPHWQYFTIQYFTLFVLLVHMLACILYLLAKPFVSNHLTGWGVVLKDYKLNPKTHLDWYIISWYFAFINVTNTGFGDIIATTSAERVLISIAMCLGFTLTTGVFIGTLSSYFVNSTFRRAQLRNQMVDIKKHLTSINMSDKHTKEIMNYYGTLWTKKKGVREAEDINLLPLPLRMEIYYDVNICLLQCSLVFRDKPESFLRSISLKMKHEFYQPGEIIYYQYVVKFKMICVASGVVEILSDEDNESPIISFAAGTCIGESALVMTLPAKATMRAANYTELQVLYKKDFLDIYKLYPEIFCEIRDAIYKRIKIAKSNVYKEEVNDALTLSIFVSHKRQNSAIKKLKDRLNPKTAYNVDRNEKFYCGTLTVYRFSENIKKRKKKFLCLTGSFPWIIQPDTSLTWTWETLIAILALIIGILYPYHIAFNRKFPDWLNYLSIILDAINILDVYMILTTAIVEKDRTIVTFKGILLHRLKTIGFYFDVFAIFYLEVYSYITPDSDHLFYVLKLNRLLKTYRICKHFAKLENYLTTNVITIRLIKYPIYLIICPYWFGAFLYLVTCFEEICDYDGWFNTKLLNDLHDRITNPCTNNPVLISVYFAMTCLSVLGYGDILAGNRKDLVVVSIAVCIGILVFGYCTAELSATITHNLKQKRDFQEALFSIQKFMNEKRMDMSIKKRIQHFFLLQWYYNKGIEIISKQSLFFNASEKIQQEVLIKGRLETITNIPLFHETDLDFMQLIATGSRIVILPPLEIVTYAGGLCRELYIIQQGYCKLIYGEATSYQIIGPNSHFGVGSILYGRPSFVTVSTITHVKLISINASIFTRAISMFPNIAKELQNLGEDFVSSLSTQAKKNNYALVKYVGDHTFLGNLNKIRHKFDGSIINVSKYCKNNNESYDKPFNALGNFRWIKYILLPFCILPDGMFIKFWVAIRFFVAFLIAVLTPYQQLQSPYLPKLDRFLIALDIIAILDLYFMMLVGYYGKDNQLIIHPLKTAAHYIKSMFTLDFLLCFPWEYLLELVMTDHEEGHSVYGHKLSPHILHCSLRLIKVFQIYRLPKAFQYLGSDIKKKGDILQILKFTICTVILINSWASVVILTSCRYYHKSDLKPEWIVGNNAKPPGMATHLVREYTMFCKEDSWIDRSKYRNFTDPIDVYMLAIYWCTGTLVGSGFGDVTSQDGTHLLVNLFMIICGILFFGYVYASISSHKAVMHSTLSHYQEMVTEFKRFMDQEAVRKELQNRIIDHFEYRWKRTGGAEPNIILANLHTALHEDAVLYMYEKILREVPLFENVDRSFFRVFGKELRERYYRRGQIVCRANDVIEPIFIIYRGTVEVATAYNEMQTYMGAGGLFGNITIHRKKKVAVSITALKNLDTLFITTSTFYNILKQYPEIRAKIETIMVNEPDYIMPTTILDDTEIENKQEMQSESLFKSSEESYPEIISQRRSVSTETSTLGTQLNNSRIRAILIPKNWFKIAILPESTLFTAFTYISMIAAYINCLIVSYQFAFQHHTTPLLILAIILDVTFMIKMFLEIHKAYIDRYGEYVTDNHKIKQMYLKQKKLRTLDFLANLPLYYLAFFLPLFTNQNPYLYFSIIRMITLLRFYYIFEFFKIRSNKLMANRLYLKLSSIIVWITLILHFFACIWYLFACPLTHCLQTSWVTAIINNRYKSKLDMYIASMYFMVNVLTTTGNGDILPHTKIELIYMSVVMVSTKFFIGVFIGDVTSVLNAYTSSLVNYEYGIAEVRDYLYNENVSEHQMEKMWHYVRQLWVGSRGTQVPRLIPMLPYVMKCEFMNEIYGKHLRNSYLFSHTEESFINQLSACFQHVVFFPGNYIVQNGDSDLSMYIIHRGEVDILTVHSNLTETIHDVLCEGEMFGIAQGLYHGVSHRFSFRARTTVDIILLQLNQWQDLLSFFPQSKATIYERARAIYTQV